MSALDPIFATLKRLDPEALFELRPTYPPVPYNDTELEATSAVK